MPDNLGSMGRLLLLAGGAIALLGLVIIGVERLAGGSGFGLGRLPGDIFIRRGSFTLYIPITTGLLLSLIARLLFGWLGRR